MSEQEADTGTAQEWDARYSETDRLWTDNPNPALVAEVSGLPAGTALDVGSGEGADARWLAERGWQVSALDISQVAIDRSREAYPSPSITWVQADLRTDDIPGTGFGLVSLQYFPIGIDDTAVLDRLLDAVGPDGQFLMVAHAPEGIIAHGRDPDAYVQPADVVARVDDSWEVVIHEIRERPVAAGGGHHVEDVVLRLRRVR